MAEVKHIKITDDSARIKVVKEEFKAPDGNLIRGVRIIIAPKVSKFVSINKETEELLEFMNPNFEHWYNNGPNGQEMILFEGYADNEL